MATVNPASDVFKFVNVRPPNQITPENNSNMFTKDDRQESEVVQLLQNEVKNSGEIFKKGSRDAGIQAMGGLVRQLTDLIKKNSYDLNILPTDPVLEKYRQVMMSLKAVKSQYAAQDVISKVGTILGSSPADFVKSGDYTRAKSKLWESLYAFHIVNKRVPQYLGNLIDGLRVTHVINYLAKNELQDNSLALVQLANAKTLLPDIIQYLGTPPASPAPSVSFPPGPDFNFLGIGDLLVVKQTLQKYQAGEVSDIENVLLGETKSRNYRKLERTEQTVTTLNETTTTTEKDNQVAARFELQNETNKTIKSDMSLQAGVTVSGKFGPVELSANTNFALNNSSEEATKSASDFAKDVTDRSLVNIQTKVSEERTTKTLLEIEEIANHSFTNTQGAGNLNKNISGIYQWVDKVYKAQIYNYGQRPMFEFIIPEPAAFYIFSQDPANTTKQKVTWNTPPTTFTILDPNTKAEVPLTPELITEDNYLDLLDRYKAKDVTLPPAKTVFANFSNEQQIKDDGSNDLKQSLIKSIVQNGLTIPDGYEADKLNLKFQVWPTADDWWGIVQVGNYDIIRDLTISPLYSLDLTDHPMAKETGTLIVSVLSGEIKASFLAITVSCIRTDDFLTSWKIKTYNTLYASYQTWRNSYESTSSSPDGGIFTVKGHNPDLNRILEKDELKKACLNVLLKQYFAQFDGINDPNGAIPPDSYPTLNLDNQGGQGRFIQFFEQAFEWEQMTYLYYPYFWGRPATWLSKIQIEDADPLFTQFLKAGSAKVVLPATNTPYYEAIMYYLQNRDTPGADPIWNGGDPPGIDDPLYKSIVAELKSQQDPLAEAVPVGDPWEVIVPTSLVYLKDDYILPDFTT